ncbi:hypothetical protein HCC61_09545 [Streptomyces sp. HNM0575]|uniref:hypothetical protein n=1 Tax=Streptomyces sp. HNM0575 TaxID=2716338 RepID=UPI00145C93E0|nr:hypothetical protein [Streptomyces sp. HNM0575]NLU72916.1 hypothetical protein [Streptomyces sp. HNM0575]
MEQAEQALLNRLRNRNFSPRLSNGWGQVTRNAIEGMSDADATVVARTWGYDFKTTYNKGNILTFLRQDAPRLDVVGGPARDVARAVPKAREEAERIRTQTGYDVLDPDWYEPVEAAAGENVKRRNKRIQGAVGIGIVTAIMTAWAIASIDTPSSVLLPGALGLVGWICVVTWVWQLVALTKVYGNDIKPKVGLIRQVLNVAEEELLGSTRR